MLDQAPHKTAGGEVRITDSRNFPISKTVAAAHVLIQPGALREMHWHPNADEWSFFIKGRARVTVFASSGTARTFDYQVRTRSPVALRIYPLPTGSPGVPAPSVYSPTVAKY